MCVQQVATYVGVEDSLPLNSINISNAKWLFL